MDKITIEFRDTSFKAFAPHLQLLVNLPGAVRSTPFEYNNVILPEQVDYCPGDVMTFSTDGTITKPSVLQVNVAVIAEDGQAIRGTLREAVIPRARPVQRVDTITWTVPELSPGNYARVTSVTFGNVDSDPVFSEVPFTIRDDCP